MSRDGGPPPESAEDIPAWFMTYSDVITLLMTFFILLLTFASSEPEKFERLQTSMFSGAGATGFAGPRPDDQEKDSVMDQRERPRASRLTMEGSRMPPINSDPATESRGKEVAGLPEEDRTPTAERFSLTFRRNIMLDGDQLTANGERMVKKMAIQLKRQPLDLSLMIHASEHQPEAMAIAQRLVQHGVLPGRIAIGHGSGSPGLMIR